MKRKLEVLAVMLMTGMLLYGFQAYGQDTQERERPTRAPGAIMDTLVEQLKGAGNDGLTLEELQKTMPNLREPMFNRMDRDNNGRLTLEEVNQVVEGWRERMDRPEGDRPPRGERMDRPEGDRPPRGERPERPEGAWPPRGERMDRPEGDRPPRGERPERPEGETDAERAQNRAAFMWQRLLDQADANEDGVITQEEFEKAFPQAPKERFEALDYNDDGRLTRRDIRQHVEAGTLPAPWGREGVERQRPLGEREGPREGRRLERPRRTE
jgi:Ca2+-binding EF-hand superfamily protein